MTPWIFIDDGFKQGLTILNSIENNKLRLFINRICQALQNGVSEKIFSDDEEEKLLISFNLELSDLKTLLQTVVLIFMRAAFHLVKVPIMESFMKENFDIGDDKIAILTHAWITHCENIIEVFKKKSIFPTRITDISWSLDIRAASSAIAKEAKPLAKLQLITQGSEESRISVEMNKMQLWDLYQKLDDIQTQLDSLKKEK